VTAFLGCVSALLVAGPQLIDKLSPDPSVAITTPGEPRVEIAGNIVRGTSSDLSENELLWLVHSKDSQGDYYPQTRPCRVAVDGAWRCTEAFIGTEADSGQAFTLTILRVNGAAVTAILDHLDRASDEEGMAQLPAGSIVATEMTVTRD
jgi:hypothetical protein